MLAAALEQLVNEMRAHPFTLIIVLCLVAVSVNSVATHASAGEVKEISDKVDRIMVLQLSESLRNLQRQRCQAEDHEARRTLSQTIDDLQREYRSLTGERYPLPPCS